MKFSDVKKTNQTNMRMTRDNLCDFSLKQVWHWAREKGEFKKANFIIFKVGIKIIYP
jgi:hypothetical protein